MVKIHGTASRQVQQLWFGLASPSGSFVVVWGVSHEALPWDNGTIPVSWRFQSENQTQWARTTVVFCTQCTRFLEGIPMDSNQNCFGENQAGHQVIPSDMWDSGGTIGSRNIHAAVDFSGSDLEIIRLGFFWGIVSINQWFLW